MVLEYQNIDLFKSLAKVRDEYTEWFNDLAVFLSYFDEMQNKKNAPLPDSFLQWCTKFIANNGDRNLINPIQEVFETVAEKYTIISEDINNGIKPDYGSFNQFKNNYNGFMASINRFYGQTLDTNEDDKKYGARLKSAIDIAPDMEREMERLARSSNPFALAMLRIDGFDGMLDLPSAINIATNNILRSIRPFDDAYFIEKGYFFISFKHADMVGADAAIARLQQSLMLDEENNDNITISCCMAEPVTGDEILELMDTMRSDLRKHKHDKEAVLKFLDISPLQRFITAKN